jgi:energy-converting hydrogenase B subunit D
MIAVAFDLLLCATLVVAAAGALRARQLFQSVVMFVVFGLLMSLAWVRLHAPDVALAEAAIGAGLTGALLLDTIGYLRSRAARVADAGPSAAGAAGPSEAP